MVRRSPELNSSGRRRGLWPANWGYHFLHEQAARAVANCSVILPTVACCVVSCSNNTRVHVHSIDLTLLDVDYHIDDAPQTASWCRVEHGGQSKSKYDKSKNINTKSKLMRAD